MLKLMITIALFLLLESAQAAIILGNPNGSVTLTFIYDYQCIHCHRTFKQILQVMDHNPTVKIRLMPVPLLNSMSLSEAKLAYVAASTPYFIALNLILMNSMPSSSQAINNLLRSQFQLNTPHFRNKMHNQEIKDELQDNMNTLKKLNDYSVPIILINSSNHSSPAIVLKGEVSEITLEKVITHHEN